MIPHVEKPLDRKGLLDANREGEAQRAKRPLRASPKVGATRLSFRPQRYHT
jgi:hypothetical protein